MASILDRINSGPAAPKPTGDNPQPTPAPAPKPAPAVPQDGTGSMYDLRNRVQAKLLAELDISADLGKPEALHKKIFDLFEQILADEKLPLTSRERSQLFEQIIAEILGFGPLDSLLADPEISEIMVNGSQELYVEKRGKITRVPVVFEDNAHVMRIIEKIVAPLGRRIDETSPYVDARLPDGSRVNAVIPPVSLVGPVLTIRKFAKIPITIEKLIQNSTLTPEAVYFIKACVEGRINIMISGGTGSGKTTLLNALSSYIPEDERIITIENAAELQLQQEHVITLESRPVNIEGKGEVTVRELVINALRMRPDRIIVGEIRDGAAFDMLQAMNTGHEGSMSTLHSNSPRDTLARLENMVLMAGMDLPSRAIREQIASALDMIIHIERLRDGTRKVTSISEVLGIKEGEIELKDIYKFQYKGFKEGLVQGNLTPSGYVPSLLKKLDSAGVVLPEQLFSTHSTHK